MNLKHFFKPFGLTKHQEQAATVKAVKQEIVCLEILKRAGRPMTTREVHSEYMRITKKNCPESGIVRAISVLKRDKFVSPVCDKNGKPIKIIGKFGSPVHRWVIK